MKKRIFALFLCTVMLLVLTACGSSGSSVDSDITDDYVVDEGPTGPTPMDIAMDLWDRLVESTIIEAEELTPADAMMNAIIENTISSVIDADEDSCKVYINYQNVVAKLLEEIALLPEELTQEALDAMYANVQAAVEANELEIIDGTFELEIITDDVGEPRLQLTPEVSIAMTGGIAGIGAEEGTTNEE